MTCRKGEYLVRYGEWVEIRDDKDELLASFKILKDMCKEAFDNYLSLRYSVSKDYKLKRIRK